MLFGNNMSWLYGKLKKKLDAPAETGSAGDVLTLGESGKPEWAEGGGGSGLPEVTSTDEGKVLTVVENSGEYEWAAATPAGGALIITLEDEEDQGTGTLSSVMDKTAGEIIRSMPLAYVLAPFDEGLDHYYSPVVAWTYFEDPEGVDPSEYYFFLDIINSVYYSCSSLSDYPKRPK